MAGYQLAYSLGADMIETDVKRTKDGHLVIMHDDTVNRTTNGTGRVNDLTLDEIRQLDAGSKFAQHSREKKFLRLRSIYRHLKGKMS